VDILEKLWLGQIAPIESAYPKTPAHRKALAKVEECRQNLLDMLPQAGQELLTTYSETEIQLQDYAERDAFSQGFRLGARLMLSIQENR